MCQESDDTAPRSYRMRRRAESAEETRRRILAAAEELIARDGEPSTLDAIAARAGVSRMTIHKRIGSRAALLEALTREINNRGGIDSVLAPLEDPDPVRAALSFVRESCRFWARTEAVVRELRAAAHSDPDAAEAVRARYRARLRLLRRLTARLAAQGSLAPGWAERDAAEALWAITNFETWVELRRTAGRSESAVAASLERMARELLREQAVAGPEG